MVYLTDIPCCCRPPPGPALTQVQIIILHEYNYNWCRWKEGNTMKGLPRSVARNRPLASLTAYSRVWMVAMCVAMVASVPMPLRSI